MILDNLDEQCAFCLESILISTYGRKDLGEGTLLNFTDGGEGMSGQIWWIGRNHSKETKLKISKSAKERFKNDPESHPMLGRNHSKETKLKMSEIRKEYLKTHDVWNKGKQHSEESKNKNRLSHCKYLYWYFDEYKNKISFYNLTQFCKENHHTDAGILDAIKENRPYKGVQYYRRLLTIDERQHLIKLGYLKS